MAIFRYVASNKKGQKRRGQLVASTENEALNKLRRDELSPIRVTDITQTLEGKLLQFIAPIRAKDLVIFTRQLAVMVSANVTIVESLLILVDQTRNLTLKNIIADIAFEVDSGTLLSDAFKKRSRVFSTFFVSIVHSGETSGRLDEVLNYLSDELEKNYDMTSKIRGAMIYPIFIIVALVVVSIILMIYVIPNLTSILTETDLDLPISTKIVIATSNFFSQYLLLVILLVIAIFLALRYYFRTKTGRRQIDLFKLRMPVFGRLFKYIYLMRFSRTLSTLVKSGVSLIRSLDITAEVVGNVIYKELIYQTISSVNDGNPIYTVMNKSIHVPNMVPQMMAVGERTGKLDLVLDKITLFYSRESSNMLDNLSKLIEPMIMVLMGVGVGIMVAAVIMPMYNLASQF